MNNKEKQQIARLTQEETKLIELFRNLTEKEKENLVEQINDAVYSYAEE